MAVDDERETGRDQYTPWLHREVQGRVTGPVVPAVEVHIPLPLVECESEVVS